MYPELSDSASNQIYSLPEFLLILSASSTWFDEPSSVNSLRRIERYSEHSHLPFSRIWEKITQSENAAS